MPTFSSEYLTVINLFRTDTQDKQKQLLGAMEEIVDNAAYEGWVSSTVHSGHAKPGTANVIQWRSHADLEKRYAGDEFKHRTVPLFTEMTTSMRLLRNEVVGTHRMPAHGGGATEISPHRDDYTVLEVFGVAEERQEELVGVLSAATDWLQETPGYRSRTVLRGVGARGMEGAFVVAYSQWDDQDAYDAFRALPAHKQPQARQSTEAQVDALVTFTEWNTYHVVHTRSAGE